MNPWQTLRDQAATPALTDLAGRQWTWLRACLARNAGCDYGREHGFADIRGVEDYRARVPLVHYEDLADRIAAVAAGAADVLFAGRPVAFERTSGSSGGSKLIPYSNESLADFRRALLPWLGNAVRDFGLDVGCAYWSISPATRTPEITPGGIPVGLPDAAYLGDAVLPAFAALSALPFDVAQVADVEDWRRLSLYWLLRRDDLALVSVWSPTFFSGLLDALDPLGAELEHLLRCGGRLIGHYSGRDLAADPAAAARLAAYLNDGDSRHLWPYLKLVSCWGDAAAAPYLEALRLRLPQAAFQAKGLLSTESVVSVPGPAGAPVLAADSGFFEFLDADAHPRLAHELAPGQTYEVVLTTAGGLYRYRSGDLVECRGHDGELPRLAFLGRAGLTSDLVGEKLADAFVGSCLAGIPGFRMLVPDAAVPGYILVLDAAFADQAAAWTTAVETALHANPHYAYARRMNQLAPLRWVTVSDALARYTRCALERGARLGDVKPPNLRPETDWPAHLEGSACKP